MVIAALVFCAAGGILLTASGCSRSTASMDRKEERDPLMRRANLKQKANEIDSAIALYQKALERNPDMARAHLNLGILYDKNKEDYIRSIYHYQRYLELRPDSEKRQMIEDLVNYARMSYAAAQMDKPTAALQTIQELKSEVARLKQELLSARIQSAASGAPPPGPAARAPEPPSKPARTERKTPSRPETPVEEPPVRAGTGLSMPSAPPAAPAMQTYRVQRGDTLSRIAKKMYNDSSRWRVIYDANRNVLKSPESLQLDQTLIIPQL